MRIDLRRESVETRLHQKPLLLFEEQLIASVLPDGDRHGDGSDGREGDGDFHRRIRTVKIEEFSGKRLPEQDAAGFDESEQNEKKHLPVASRIAEAAAKPAVKIEIEKWREVPDEVFVGRQ